MAANSGRRQGATFGHFITRHEAKSLKATEKTAYRRSTGRPPEPSLTPRSDTRIAHCSQVSRANGSLYRFPRIHPLEQSQTALIHR